MNLYNFKSFLYFIIHPHSSVAVSYKSNQKKRTHQILGTGSDIFLNGFGYGFGSNPLSNLNQILRLTLPNMMMRIPSYFLPTTSERFFSWSIS